MCRSGTPVIRAYWPRPFRIAATAASLAKGGPSKSGNPCARLTAPRSAARCVISVKIVVPNPASRRAMTGRMGKSYQLSALSRQPGPEESFSSGRIYFRWTFAKGEAEGRTLGAEGCQKESMPLKIHYRVAIIGTGPAGWTAALYASRADLEPVIFEGPQPGGQLTITTDVENYPGFAKGIQGPELMEIFREQATRFGTEVILDTVADVDFSARPFRLTLDSGASLTADAVIVSSGASAKLLEIESEKRFFGRGVSACATCDGFFFKGKEVVVVGGGDTAMEEATFLTKF